MSYKKCVVWDLDNTLWDNVCIEGDIIIRKHIIRIIKELDQRGILHSIASRGDEGTALKKLKENDMSDYFVAVKINWLQKSNNIIDISNELNISLGSIVFVDDDDFELEQMKFMLPEVLAINAVEAYKLLEMKELMPEVITNESKQRRQFYKAEQIRKRAESIFDSREDFLISCKMILKIRRMQREDVPRVLELMTRTHQLNTTGWILNKDDLLNLFLNEAQTTIIYVAELVDKFGSYGIIGVAIEDNGKQISSLKYLAVSCRVMGRGIERAILITLMKEVFNEGFIDFYGEFHDTGKNKLMRALYQMMDFNLIENSKQINNDLLIFHREQKELPELPKWIKIV